MAYGEESAPLFPTHLRTVIGSLLLAPLSELYGRSRALQLANMFYLGMHFSLKSLRYIFVDKLFQ